MRSDPPNELSTADAGIPSKVAFGKPVCIVAAEVTRLKYSWESSIFMQRNEPRYLGCYNFKTRSNSGVADESSFCRASASVCKCQSSLLKQRQQPLISRWGW